MCTLDYPYFIVSNQKEEFISIMQLQCISLHVAKA